ncbi:sulfatase-like hydrolase/transferase [Halovivax gelatinilyticus]|uniref:sulfatase-like hydrolase/transferase n=1 Tax=Halovivax gelatinilyticus TaxID=2961597 RepID=UPI0020CA6FCC|nr:sulfatase-like hydrolase/transferase [Halovivax gelatinilyticus]
MADSPPNVLLLLSDQERYDVSAPAGPPVETPAIDRLAADGMRFTRAVTPISICTSARASLLTGQFPHGHGMVNNCHEEDALRVNLDPDLPTFSEQLAGGGYDLTYTGKWHVGRDQTPEDFGFSYLGGSDVHHDDIDEDFARYRDEEIGIPLGEVEFSDAVYTRGGEGSLVAATTPVDVEATRAYFLARRTIEAIEAHAAGGDDSVPFFHRADFYGPHHPYVVPEPYASMYDPDEVELPASYAETYAGKPRVQEAFLGYRGVDAFDRETWREVLAKYWGFVSLIDDQIDRILSVLDDSGLAAETVVVHTADHGDFVGGHRQFNKGPLMYDDTYRIPLHVRWPGEVAAGSTCDAPVHLHDLAPTFCEIGDVAVPDSFHARSLRPLLSGRRPHAWPDSTFGQYYGEEFGLYTQRMVRTDRYKFVYNGPDVNELYDLRADPAELTNLIDHPDYAAVRRDLVDHLVGWMDETDDPYRRWVPKTFA